MHVMSTEGDANTITIAQYIPLLSQAIIVLVDQLPKLGNAGVIDLIAASQHTRAGAFFQVIKTIRHHRHLIRFTIAISVDQTPNAIILLCVGDSGLTKQSLVIVDAILNGTSSQVS